MTYSPLQQKRAEYVPPIPTILNDLRLVNFTEGHETTSIADKEELKKLFPHTFGQPVVHCTTGKTRTLKPLRVGVVLSGGQAAGGHNVIAGLFDALKALYPESSLIGFLGGPSGIVNAKFLEITKELLAPYRNQGGFDIIGSGRTKIETEEQLIASLATMQSLKLDGLVIIGGDDSNTNAAVLAEYYITHNCLTRVIGVPKTIDGDLQNEHVAISFGFDTACKVYSEMIGNLARDCLSAKKYTHFVKLMGRAASHIAIECALLTHPNCVIIGEEVAAKKKTLKEIVNEIADVITFRANKGKDYGIILLPEGLIEFIPEVGALIGELNKIAMHHPSITPEEVVQHLSEEAKACFLSIPLPIQKQLLLERDPHGNVQLSLIETELLLIEEVSVELKKREEMGTFKGKFTPLHHFFGYEGRSGFPSNFDAHYCYALGMTSALLIDEGLSGYMCFVEELAKPISDWKVGGIPITMLLNLEMRKGKTKPVIQKALVDLQGKPYLCIQKEREKWALADDYRSPGPIQFYGGPEITDTLPLSLTL